MKKTVAGVLLAVVTATALAGPIEDQIRGRQAAFAFLGWNFGKIKAQVVEHPETYNKEQVVAAANAVAAVANSGLGSLFGPGTEQGTGFHPTKVKPEFFKEPEKVKEIATTFSKEATELARVAASGDAGAIKTQFGKVGESCKSCHNNYRVRD
jgi:cytochrome c556